jgi:hypothetical protein
MATQGRTLQVFIAADTQKFRKGLDDAERRMGGFQGAIGGLAGSFKNMLGPAMLGAGIAAGALATQFAVDGVKAAMEQEAANKKLADAFAAVGIAQDTEKAKAYVDELQRATGVSEDELLPALTQLATKTGDFNTAQGLLNTALDVSARTGKPVSEVAQALVKAYDGNFRSLKNLVPELDAATIKSGDLKLVTDELQKLFGGAASSQAETFKGKIDRLALGFGELKESFGEGFLKGIQEAMDKLGGTDSLGQTMQDLEPVMMKLGEDLGLLIGDLLTITTEAGNAYKAFTEWKDGMGPIGTAIDQLLVSPLTRLADALRTINALRGAGDTPGGVTFGSPGAGLRPGSTGGGNFAATPMGAAPVSTSRAPSTVAPVTALNNAMKAQATRTSGKVRLLA